MAAFISLAASAGLYLLSHRLIGQLHISTALRHEAASQSDTAAAELRKAATYLPANPFIHNALGDINYRMASSAATVSDKIVLLQQAKSYFADALAENPLDARSAYGLARVAIRLEQLEILTGNRDAGGAAMISLTALEKAIAMRPASIIYRLTLVRYLHLYNQHQRLMAEIQEIGRLQPASLGQLRSESFWSADARDAFRLGVQEALDTGITPRQSFLALSEITADEKNWQQAVSFRIKGMAVQPSLNTSADYVRLGFLYSMAGQPEAAMENFFLALDYSADVEKDIIAILRICRKADARHILIDFYRRAGEIYGYSARMDIIGARLLMDMQDYENAEHVLGASTIRQPQNAEAYYLMTRIAEKEQNWDEYELSIQKAAMYDPDNSEYHLLFSQVLKRRGKYERAEKEAGLAIKYTTKSTPAIFHYRASLRQQANDHAGALADWQQAAAIDPENPVYLFHAGDAAEQMGRIDMAAGYFRLAMELEPGNKRYSQRLERLIEMYGVK